MIISIYLSRFKKKRASNNSHHRTSATQPPTSASDLKLPFGSTVWNAWNKLPYPLVHKVTKENLSLKFVGFSTSCVVSLPSRHTES